MADSTNGDVPGMREKSDDMRMMMDDRCGNAQSTTTSDMMKRKAESPDLNSLPQSKRRKSDSGPDDLTINLSNYKDEAKQDDSTLHSVMNNCTNGLDNKENDKNLEENVMDLKVPSAAAQSVLRSATQEVLNLSKMPSQAEDGQQTPCEVPSDGPMDLSSRGPKPQETSPQATSDVICLSDEEAEEGSSVSKATLRRLQEDLRNEETKLVLLKKIQQSQLLTPQPQANTVPQRPSTSPMPSAPRPPLAAHQPTPNRTVSGQPPTAHNRTPSVPPKAPVATSSHTAVTASPQPAVAAVSATPPAPKAPEQSPAQRQAAAKLALRKQLEKTLLQIPPPKPPPPEMNFIPSLSSGEFVPLIGLEEVVKYILEADARAKGNKGPDVRYVFNPFTCVQCRTDFTPVWKRDKPGSKNVICEQCVTTNQKKMLKQEHTNRLKSAFVRALQQEQEIEQRLQQEKTHPPVTSAPAPNAKSSTPSRPISSSVPHTSSVRNGAASSSSSAAAAATLASYTDQLRHVQNNFLQAQQAAQLRSLGLHNLPAFSPHLAFQGIQPFPQPPITAKQAADLHRQYLLDLIQPRNLPTSGSNPWRK